MRNIKLFDLFEELKSINLSGKAGYCVAKNRKLIEDELEILRETIKPSDKFKEYDEKRVELAKKYAKKDKNNEAVSEKSHFVLENEEEFNKELKLLNEEYKEELDKRDEQIKSFNELLEQESKLQLYKLDEKDIPESATAQEVYVLLKLI